MKRRETEERNGRGTAVGRMRYIAPGCVFAVLLLLMLLRIAQIGTVSYTHLTLPTIPDV